MRFILHPGFIVSASDGQEHYVGARKLSALYGVRLSDCIVVSPDVGLGLGYRPTPDDVHLYPRVDGDYSVLWEG